MLSASKEDMSDGFLPHNDQLSAVGGKFFGKYYSLGMGYEAGNVREQEVEMKAAAVEAIMGGAKAKVSYIVSSESEIFESEQKGASMSYTMGNATLTAFYRETEFSMYNETMSGATAKGIGASYDLGNGAQFKAGLVEDRDEFSTQRLASAGITMNF